MALSRSRRDWGEEEDAGGGSGGDGGELKSAGNSKVPGEAGLSSGGETTNRQASAVRLLVTSFKP